jgi:hypothetical protein
MRTRDLERLLVEAETKLQRTKTEVDAVLTATIREALAKSLGLKA